MKFLIETPIPICWGFLPPFFNFILVTCLRMSACVSVLSNRIIFANIGHITFVLCKSFLIFFHDIHFWYSIQGFPRDGRNVPVGGMENFAGFFLLGVGNLRRSEFDHLCFKLKTTFCRYWTLIKIKINMTCVYKEYEVRIKW